jgi:hypothetical protein
MSPALKRGASSPLPPRSGGYRIHTSFDPQSTSMKKASLFNDWGATEIKALPKPGVI